jgi:hypothetical protein
LDPISAAVVIGLLSRYARHLAGQAGQVVDEQVKEGMAALWRAIRARFAADPVASGALDRMAEQPDNEKRAGAVEDHLSEVMTADPGFAEAVGRLVAAATPTVTNVTVANSGVVATGGSVTVASGWLAAGRDAIVSGATPSTKPGTSPEMPASEARVPDQPAD